IRVEVRRGGPGEVIEECGAAATIDGAGTHRLEIGANIPRLGHVPDDQKMTAGESLHLRRRRARLFVVVLAMNEGREPVAGVALHALPDVEHRAAGRVDHDAADAAERLKVTNGHPERGQDYDIVRGDAAVVEARCVR